MYYTVQCVHHFIGKLMGGKTQHIYIKYIMRKTYTSGGSVMYILFIRIKNAFVELSANIIAHIQTALHTMFFLKQFSQPNPPILLCSSGHCLSSDVRRSGTERSSYNAIYLKTANTEK